jgi:hypothetical protein
MQVRDLRGRGAVQDQEFAMVEGSQIGKQMRVVVARATPRVIAVYCYNQLSTRHGSPPNP